MSTMTSDTAAKMRYNERNYDQINIRMRKGAREVINALALDRGMSTAEFVRHCVIVECQRNGIDIHEPLGGGGVDEILERLRRRQRARENGLFP